MMNELTQRIHNVQTNIAAAARVSGREAKDVTLMAVTKTWSANVVRDAYTAGLRHFGENYVQEALKKKSELTDLSVDWHFIGHLQSNKVKNVVGEFSIIHSLDRLSLAEEVSKRAVNSELSEPQKVLIEINVADEPSKSGVSWSELPKLLDNVQELPGVSVRGLMAMPPLELSDQSEIRRVFNNVRDERDRLAPRLSAPHSLMELSMGTTHDYVAAIEAGATIVRLGTALFGSRG